MMSPTSHVMRYTYEKRSSKYGDVEIPPLKYNYNLSTTFYGRVTFFTLSCKFTQKTIER